MKPNLRDKKGIIAATIMAAILATGCTHRPDGVLSEKKMVKLQSDIEFARGYAGTQRTGLNRNNSTDLYLDAVLADNGVTREQYDSTMRWYTRNLDEYITLCDKVEQELHARQAKYDGEQNTPKAEDDLWPWVRHAVIWPGSESGTLRFSIPAEEVDPGSRINLKMRLRTPSEVNTMLGVEYRDGSYSYISRQDNSRNKLDYTLQTDTAQTVKRIFGYVTSIRTADLPISIDSIGLTKLPIDSTQYYRINTQRRYGKPVKKIKKTETTDADQDTDAES